MGEGGWGIWRAWREEWGMEFVFWVDGLVPRFLIGGKFSF